MPDAGSAADGAARLPWGCGRGPGGAAIPQIGVSLFARKLQSATSAGDVVIDAGLRWRLGANGRQRTRCQGPLPGAGLCVWVGSR